MARIRLASYNVHRAIGTDRRCDPERILEVLREIDADVYALQEVEASDTGADMLEWLGKSLGLHAIAGPTLLRHDGQFGNGLLARWPIQVRERVDLSVWRFERRGALSVDLEFEDGRHLQVVATHLGLLPAERRRQVRRLLKLFTFGPEDRAVLLGDLNEWFLWGRPLRRLHRHFDATRALRTFPSWLPILALDRLWTHPGSMLRGLHVHASTLARVASDHLPLVATLEV